MHWCRLYKNGGKVHLIMSKAKVFSSRWLALRAGDSALVAVGGLLGYPVTHTDIKYFDVIRKPRRHERVQFLERINIERL